MKEIKLNYIALTVILGITDKAARKVVWDALYKKTDDPCKITPVTGKDRLPIDWFAGASCPEIPHMGNDIVTNAIKGIQTYGVTGSLKREIFEDISCVMYGDLKGKYRFLNKILTQTQLEAVRASLSRRRAEYLNAGGKCPNHLEKYIKDISYRVSQLFE